MLVWRPAALPPELSWIAGNEFAEVRVFYEEKNPWDPLAGTTLKRNYRCEIERVSLLSSKPGPPARTNKGSPLRFRGWCDPASVYVWPAGTLVVRGPGDDFAGSDRVLVLLRPDGSERVLARPEDGQIVRSAVPAPDRSALLVLTGSAATGTGAAYFLRLNDGRRIDIEAGGARPEDWIWRRDSSGAVLRYADGRVLAANLVDGRTLPVAEEPVGFTPPTRGGGPVSADGIRYYFDESQGRFVGERDRDYRNFDDIAP